MLGSTHLTLVLGAAPANTSPAATMKGYVRALADAGLSVLFIQPGTKVPVDLRSAQARKKAAEAGDDRAGLYLATSDKATLARYVEAARKKYGDDAALNLAVHAGRSRVVIIDADTPDEVQSWISWWSQATGQDMTGVPPTVTTPGAQDDDGGWKHHGGGHWYLRLPEGFEVPRGCPAKVKVGRATAYVGDAYVLIPPSTRPEGRYEMTGTDYDAPQALLDLLVPPERPAKAEKDRTPTPPPVTREKADQAPEETGASLEEWLNDTPWAEILDGWEVTGTDKCGCAQWRAPGLHDSPKSAVTHEGCGDHEDGGRLHVWTDNPQTGTALDDQVAAGRKSFSKLQAYAWMHHDGDVTAAMDALGIDRSTAESGGGLLEVGKKGTEEGKPGKAAGKPAPRPVETKTSTWLDDQEFPPLKWVIPGMIPEGYTIVAGPPKLGKSWFVLAIILATAVPGGRVLGAIDTGPARPVLYLDLEGSDRRLQQRSRAIQGEGVRLPAFEYANEGQTDDLLETIRDFFARNVGKDPVVVVDTVAKLRTGDTRERGENAYEADYRFGVRLVELVRAHPGASIIGVFHRKKGVEGGDFVEAVSGSSGTTAAADTIVVAKKPRDDDRGVLHVTSRDAVGGDYAVRMTEDGGWKLDGDTLQEAIDNMATRRMDERLGDDTQEVIDAAQSMPGEFTSRDVVEALGGGTDAAKVGAILRNLTRGRTPRVVKVGRGTFRWAGGRVLSPPPPEGVCVSD